MKQNITIINPIKHPQNTKTNNQQKNDKQKGKHQLMASPRQHEKKLQKIFKIPNLNKTHKHDKHIIVATTRG